MSTRTQQEAVYAAESESLGGYGRRFADVREIQAYLDELAGSAWWLDRWPSIGRVVVERFSSRRWAGVARTQELRIAVAYGAATEDVVLHELAHIVTPDEEHSPVFCHALLMLVRERMGFFAWVELERALRLRGCLDGRLIG